MIVANPDQVVFVFACADPDPNFRMLDRLLVVAEREQIPAQVCANKIDLVVERAARDEFDEYARLGYPVHYVSALTGKGIKGLRKALAGKISVFAGPSGVGKSSMLNAIQPGLGLHTGEVSQAYGKGTHTTVVPELMALEVGGYVADTPGLRAFALLGHRAGRARWVFPRAARAGGRLRLQRLHAPARAGLRGDRGRRARPGEPRTLRVVLPHSPRRIGVGARPRPSSVGAKHAVSHPVRAASPAPEQGRFAARTVLRPYAFHSHDRVQRDTCAVGV